MRKVLPLTLVLSLAAFGCTMNRTPGNGQPVSVTPSRSPAATPGSSSGNVPMASSYTVPTSNTRLSADDAAAMMREHQAYNGRVLGYLSPAPLERQQGQQLVSGQSVAPYASPQITLNSTISSKATPAIASGSASEAADVTELFDAAAVAGVPVPAAVSVPAATTAPLLQTGIATTTATATTPGVLAATGQATLTPTTRALSSNSFGVPSTTANASTISVSNASGKIVISNVKNQ